MTALVLAVMTMSLLGGLHCVGMCGAFVVLAVNPGLGSHNRRPPGALALQAAYHAGRLASYTLLGVLGGALGATVDLSARLAGVQRAALALSSGVLIVFGVATVLRLVGIAVPRFPLPAAVRGWADAGHRLAFRMDALPRALAIGLMTALLPCGWLYVFVVTAAGTGDAARGALVMAMFWTGTLPWLMALGGGARLLAGPLAARLPVLTACGLIAAGLFTLSGRFALAGLRPPGEGAASTAALAAAGCHPPEVAHGQ